jgi:hypothetical protein
MCRRLRAVESVRLEVGKLPDALGVRAALLVLEQTPSDLGPLEVSVGRVCGGRVSGVYLGDSLEVCSFTLEPFELDNAELGARRALEFLARLRELLGRV